MKFKKITLRVNCEEYNQLQSKASREGKSLNRFIIDAATGSSNKSNISEALLRSHIAQLQYIYETNESISIREFSREESAALWQILKLSTQEIHV